MAIDILIAALETHLHMLEELFSLLQRETGELTAINLDAMAETNVQKESLAVRIEEHSTVLRKVIEEAAVRVGLSSKSTLGELASVCKQTGNKDVSRLHQELNKVGDQVREVVSINKEVAERFAESVSSSLELLTRVINQSTTYGAYGGYQQRPATAVMINREA